MKVSVGVAVYNGERYLEHCLDSLISQTLNDLEIILVDDGSTDSSGGICDQYAERDSRIKVIHKPNGGLASARQTALEVATGDYFCVCDADDWMEADMYEKLWEKAEETGADVVMCGNWREYDNGKSTISVYDREIPSDNSQIIEDVLNDRFPSFLWNKLFRRNLFRKFAIEWEPGIDMQEDFLMTLKVLQHPVKLACLPELLYHYRRMRVGNSYTGNITLSSYNQMLHIMDWIDGHLDADRFAVGKTHYMINIAYAGLRVKNGMSPEYYKQTSTSRLSVRDLWKEHSLKAQLILLTKVLGYHFGFFVNQLLYKIEYIDKIKRLHWGLNEDSICQQQSQRTYQFPAGCHALLTVSGA